MHPDVQDFFKTAKDGQLYPVTLNITADELKMIIGVLERKRAWDKGIIASNVA